MFLEYVEPLLLAEYLIQRFVSHNFLSRFEKTMTTFSKDI